MGGTGHTSEGDRARRDAAMRAANGQPTRAAILTAAGELASLEGLERLAMRRLAAAVGISKSALYEHFPSQEELQLAVIAHGLAVFESEVVSDPRVITRGSLDALEALLERWLAFFEVEVFPGGCFFVASALEFASRPGRIRDALERALDREVEVLETAIVEAQDAGELPDGKDAGETAFELHAIVLHAHTLFRVKSDAAFLERARPALRRVISGSGG